MRGDLRKLARQKQGDPAAHARSYENRGVACERMGADRGGLAEPFANRAFLESSAGFSMTGVIEPQASGAVLSRPIASALALTLSISDLKPPNQTKVG